MKKILVLLSLLIAGNAYGAGQWTSTQTALSTPASSDDYIMTYEKNTADGGQRAIFFNGTTTDFLNGAGAFVPGVTSFNSRTGVIVPAESDYSSFFLALASCTTTGEIPVWNQTTSLWACGTQTGGTTTWIGLTDTPASYSGYAGYFTRVNAAGDGIEFTVAPSGTTDLTNTPGSSTVDINSSSGLSTTIPAATTSLAGVMTAADKSAVIANTAKVTYPGDELTADELAAINGAATPSAANVLATMNDVAAAGGGDMLSTNNLSDVADAPTSYANIKQAGTEAATGAVELSTDLEAVQLLVTNVVTTPANIGAILTDKGYMAGATYDPSAVGGDVFDMDNMIESATSLVLTAPERTKLTGIEDLADVTSAINVAAAGAVMNTGDETIAGLKTFTSTVTAPSFTSSAAEGEHFTLYANASACPTLTASEEGAKCHRNDTGLDYVWDGSAWAVDSPETNSLETTVTGIADTEIFIGNGLDSGTFAAISGDATLSNAGVLSVDTSSNTETLTNKTISSASNTITIEDAYCVALSDESTDIAVGTDVRHFPMPYNFTVTDVVLYALTSQPHGSVISVDINEEGTSILSTEVTIDPEVYATGSSTISGISGSVDSISVGGVAITSAVVPYNTSGDTAATGSVDLTGGISGSVDSVTVNAVTITSAAVPYNNSGDTAATGSVEITAGTDGEVSSVTVNGITITSAAVPFNTDLTTTAVDLAANITAFASVPNYTATSALGVVTITASDPGEGSNTYVVASVTTLTLTTTDTDLAGGVSDLTATAVDFASNITAFASVPNYTATSAGTLVTITASDPGEGSNTYAVLSTTTTITTLDTALSGGVSDISATATDVASNITAFTSTPNYSATSALGVVTISAETGADANALVVATTATTLTAVDADMAGGTTEKNSSTAAIPVVISDSSIAQNADMSADITAIGSTTAGSGLKLCLIGTRSM